MAYKDVYAAWQADPEAFWMAAAKGIDWVKPPSRALYMAALSALRSSSCFAKSVAALRAKGKPGKVIAIAMARKLLVIANAIISKQEPFRAAKQ